MNGSRLALLGLFMGFWGQAQPAFDSLLGPPPLADSPRNSFRYELSGSHRLTEQDVRLGTELHRTPQVGVGAAFGSKFLVLEAGALEGKKLWMPELSAYYRHHSSGGDTQGLIISADSPSDVPFQGGDEINASVTGYYKLMREKGSAWFFFLNYATHRSFLLNIPLPLASYFYLSSDRRFSAMIGLPFFLNWRYLPTTYFRMSLLFPALVTLESGVKVASNMDMKVQGQWKHRSFLLAGRTDKKEQFYFEEKTAGLGIESRLNEYFTLEVLTGLSFDRRVFHGRGFFKHDKRGVQRLERSAFGKASLGAKF